MESPGELEFRPSIVEWVDRWLVTFNATKTKLLSFNRHMRLSFSAGGDEWQSWHELHELPEETSFRLLGLTFTRSMDWKPYIQSIAKAASRKVGSLYRFQRFLTPESICINLPFGHVCSHIWVGAPRSHVLDLLDRGQKRAVITSI